MAIRALGDAASYISGPSLVLKVEAVTQNEAQIEAWAEA